MLDNIMCGSRLVVLCGFYCFVFVFAATIVVRLFSHSAFFALMFVMVNEGSIDEVAHTVMQVHGSTHGTCHVQHCEYGDYKPLHENSTKVRR